MTDAWFCRGHKRDRHEARYVYHDGLCSGCRYRRDTDAEPIEPPDPEPPTGRDDDYAADVWQRTNWRDW